VLEATGGNAGPATAPVTSAASEEEDMADMTLLAFAVVAFIGIATPGPTVLLALANGSRFGVRRALTGMAGAVLSDFVLIGAVALGLGALLAASEFWFGVVKWVGVCYLAFLGIMLLRSRGTLDGALQSASNDAAGSARSIFLKSFLVAVTNPKGYLFFSAFLPQFIDPAMPQIQQYAVLALVFAGIDFIVMFGYALLGSQAVKILRKSGALWLDRVCGGALLTLAASLAFYRRASA
jgi:threonine/homoserine/homoserine lactone efflux protein